MLGNTEFTESTEVTEIGLGFGMRSWVHRWLECEIYFVHVGHGLLGVGAMALVFWHLPWWGILGLMPLVAFSLWFWTMEASLVLPVVNRLLRGDAWEATTATTATATTRPRGR